MITLTREEAQKVLDALNTVYGAPRYEASKILRAKLSEPKQEPVAYLWECLGRWSAMLANDGEHADLSPPSWLCDAVETATTPPQREWVGLTDEEEAELDEKYGDDINVYIDQRDLRLKEKNT